MLFSRLGAALSFLSLAAYTTAAPSSRALNKRGEGKTIPFEVTLTWEDYSAIGVARKTILVNGTSPGPALRMQVGDTVEFLVHNELPDPTTIHFHGIVQQGTPWSDGVPGLTQAAIEPGKSFLYKWTADASGSYFYHSHYRSQIMDGLYGAIVVNPADDADLPFSLINADETAVKQMTDADVSLTPIFVNDFNKYTSAELHAQEEAGNLDFACADAILVNGKGSQYCLSRDELTAYTNPKMQTLLNTVSGSVITDKGCLPPLPATQGNFTFDVNALPSDAYFTCTPSTGDMEVITVDPAKGWAALTFINPGGYEILKYTIDGHKMWVYALDGGYITPQLVDQVILNNGDRFSVLIQLNQAPAQYSIRVSNQGLNQIISGFGVLAYKGATGPATEDPNALAAMNYAGTNLTTLVPFNEVKAAPYPASPPAPGADLTYIFNIKKLGQPFKAFEWTLSGVEGFNSSREDVTPPLIEEDPADVAANDLILKTNANQWVDLIINVQGPLSQPHPMHKHSNKAYVLGKGVGAFNFTTVAAAAAVLPAGTFNFVNPPLRDGYTTTPSENNSTWMVLRYQVVNPGPFLFHCHIQTHVAGGMAIAFLDGVDKWPEVPTEYANGGNGLTVSKLKKKGILHRRAE